MQNTLIKEAAEAQMGGQAGKKQSSIKESTQGQVEFLRINPATEYLHPHCSRLGKRHKA